MNDCMIRFACSGLCFVGRDLRSHGQEELRPFWIHGSVDLPLHFETPEAIRTMETPSASRSAPSRRCVFSASLDFARQAGICQSSLAGPMRKERLDGEMKIIGEYGLKNKREAGLTKLVQQSHALDF